MADPTTVSGSVIFIQYSDTPTGTRKSAVCQSQGDFTGSTDVNSEQTNCGVLKSIGKSNNQFSLNAVVDLVPDLTEASYNEFQTIYVNKTKKYWHLSNGDNSLYHGGYGWISALGQQNASGQTAKFTMTIDIDGDIAVDPPI